MNLAEFLELIGIIVGIIGIGVGSIGVRLIYLNRNITRNIEGDGNSVQQGSTIINNGVGYYAVIKIAKDITKEELDEITYKIADQNQRIDDIKKENESKPNIHIGKTPPDNAKVGDLFLQEMDDEKEND